MREAAKSGWLIGFGLFKVLALFLLIYWVSRALALADGARLRLLGDSRSAWLFAGVLAWSFGTGLLQLFGGDLLALFNPAAGALIAISAVYTLAIMVIDIYLAVWKTGASLGNAQLTIPASFRIMNGNFWWSFGYFLVVFLPALVLHYALNIVAIGKAPAILWPLLIGDALIVGFLGLVGAAAVYITARRATSRDGLALAP